MAILLFLLSMSAMREVACDPHKNETNHASNNSSSTGTGPVSKPQMGPFGYMTMQSFIIMSVVLFILLVVLLGLMIACCCWCCRTSRTSWKDLHPSEIKAGMTPSMADAGLTLSQIVPAMPVAMPHPAPYSPLAPYNPHSYPVQPVPVAVHIPDPVPVAKKKKASDSDVISNESDPINKKKGGVTLKKGVILPSALIGVKPKNKKKGRKRRNDDDDDDG